MPKSKNKRTRRRQRRRSKQNKRLRVFFSTGGVCYLCGVRLLYESGGRLHNSGEPPPNLFTIDHVLPASRGGVNGVSNLKPACYQCNQTKGAQVPDSSAASSPG